MKAIIMKSHNINNRHIINKNFIYCFSFLIWCSFLLYTGAYASSITINPVRLVLSAGQKTTSFEVTNDSTEPLVVQLHAMEWKHHYGKDIYEATKDVLVTPPIARIPPGKMQIVRVGLLKPTNPKKGATYRVFIQEVSQSSIRTQTGVQTLLEIVTPLLVDPLIPPKPKMTISGKRLENNRIHLSLLNTGETHFQIFKITVGKPGQTENLFTQTIFSYLIPSQKKELEFEIPESLTGKNIQAIIGTDHGEVSTIISLSSS